MGRWEANARGRLEQAALELYSAHGFEQTTVAEIAARAGLTERTFFRHFADKREVLFSGAAALQDLLVRGVTEAPDFSAPIEPILGALVAAADGIFEERHALARRRQEIIDANPDLQERELIKLARLADALAAALRQRKVPDPAAALAAEAGIAVFKVAFERWTGAGDDQTLARRIRESASDLNLVIAGAR